MSDTCHTYSKYKIVLSLRSQCEVLKKLKSITCPELIKVKLEISIHSIRNVYQDISFYLQIVASGSKCVHILIDNLNIIFSLPL